MDWRAMLGEVPSFTQIWMAFVVALIGIGMRGFQHKNVIGSHYKLIGSFAYLIVLMEGVSVLFIVKGGLWITIPAGIGAAIGMMSSTYIHDRWVRKG